MLSWEYPPYVVGGLGKHVAELLPALARQGAEVHLVTPNWAGGENEKRLDGATVHRVDPPLVNHSDHYTAAWQTNLKIEGVCECLWEQAGGFDLIHAHDWLVAFAANALKRNFKTPLLSTIHATERGRNHGSLSNDLQRAINSVEWWLTYESWRLICCSAFMAGEVMDFFDIPADKVDVVPNGVDAARFDALEGVDLERFRVMYALPAEQIVFCVGRLVREKGLRTLVEAVPRVLAVYPQAKFVIAGTGPMAGELRRRAWELGVAPKILFTGFITDEDRDRLYKLADCAVFPSLYEPFGIVALEAMAAGTPVVVAEVGGLREVVEHGETGVTVYPDNPDSLAWGILHTLQHPEWTEARVKNAYRAVLDEYNWDGIARETIAVYERIVQERAVIDW